MDKGEFKGLIIRTAQVIESRYGFIYACDPKLESRGEPHAYVFAWDNGTLERGDSNYDAHSVCLIEDPGRGSVDIAEAGYYSAESGDDRVTLDIFANSAPPPAKKRVRGLRSVREIEGRAHAIGVRGLVYRLDRLDQWTRIDEGLPASFDGQAIHGFGLDDLFAAGFAGQLWHFDGRNWNLEDMPTSQNFNAIVCAADGTVYVGGHGGALVRGMPGQWRLIAQGDTDQDIWDLEWFAGKLYASTLDGLFVLDGDHLKKVDFGRYTPRSTYQLSANGGVMWSSGEMDIMEFDGTSWTRIL